MKPGKMALVGKIAGKPRQEKHQRGVPGELAQTGAYDLTTAQQTPGVTPVKWNVLDFFVNVVCADVIQFCFISRA